MFFVFFVYFADFIEKYMRRKRYGAPYGDRDRLESAQQCLNWLPIPMTTIRGGSERRGRGQ